MANRRWGRVIVGVFLLVIGIAIFGLGVVFAAMSLSNGNDWKGPHGALGVLIQALVGGGPFLVGGAFLLRSGLKSTVAER
jgi:Mn2+/Fe2+ NRAMP family transporter